MNNLRYLCRRDYVGGMGSLGSGFTDFLSTLPTAITGTQQSVSALEAKGAELETAIKAQLALSTVIAAGMIILVIQSLKGK
jgi:predicted dinucleotide-binding enzyme